MSVAQAISHRPSSRPVRKLAPLAVPAHERFDVCQTAEMDTVLPAPSVNRLGFALMGSCRHGTDEVQRPPVQILGFELPVPIFGGVAHGECRAVRSPNLHVAMAPDLDTKHLVGQFRASTSTPPRWDSRYPCSTSAPVPP